MKNTIGAVEATQTPEQFMKPHPEVKEVNPGAIEVHSKTMEGHLAATWSGIGPPFEAKP